MSQLLRSLPATFQRVTSLPAIIPMANGAMADITSSNDVTGSEVNFDVSSEAPLPESPDRVYALVVE